MGGDNDNVGTTHPQTDPEKAAKETKAANTPASLTGGDGRAGGKSAASDGGTGGVGHG